MRPPHPTPPHASRPHPAHPPPPPWAQRGSTDAHCATTRTQHAVTAHTNTHDEGDDMTNPRRTNSTKRNKVRAQVLREEDHCWLCGEQVDTKLKAGLPSSPEVDEILPVSLGGNPYDRTNCRLSHRLCNQQRGNKLPHEAIIAARERATHSAPLKTSREW